VARAETLSERKARLEREVLAAEKRKQFLESERAVKPAEDEAKKLLSEIQRLASSLSTDDFPLKVEPDNGGIRIKSYGFILQAYWHLNFSNSLMHSGFYLRLIELDRQDHFHGKFNERKKLQFRFSVNEAEQYGWHSTWGDKRFFTSIQLAEFGIQMILDAVTDYRRRQARDIQ